MNCGVSAARSRHSSGVNIAVSQNAGSRATRTTKPFRSGKEALSRHAFVPKVIRAVWPILDAAQFDFELVLCRPHTFGVPLLCESWDNKREESQDELWSANSSKSGSGFKCPFAYACPVTE